MSLFSWFSPKASPNPVRPPESSGLNPDAATVPLISPNRLQAKAAPPPDSTSGSRKTERLERREQLYTVVRDAMTRAGVLSASYKFKVLSLDPRGKQYLIMMDLSQQAAGETGRLAEIESVIAQSAKSRHDILVTAVYWRLNEHVTAGLTATKPNSGVSISRPAPLTPMPQNEPAVLRSSAVPVAMAVAATAPVASQASRYEPLQADEVVAFKNALASANTVTPLVAPGEIVKSGRRNPAREPEFENTELVEGAERASPLSGTQYGELN